MSLVLMVAVPRRGQQGMINISIIITFHNEAVKSAVVHDEGIGRRRSSPSRSLTPLAWILITLVFQAIKSRKWRLLGSRGK